MEEQPLNKDVFFQLLNREELIKELNQNIKDLQKTINSYQNGTIVTELQNTIKQLNIKLSASEAYIFEIEEKLKSVEIILNDEAKKSKFIIDKATIKLSMKMNDLRKKYEKIQAENKELAHKIYLISKK